MPKVNLWVKLLLMVLPLQIFLLAPSSHAVVEESLANHNLQDAAQTIPVPPSIHNHFYGKIHVDLYRRLKEASPSEILTVIATFEHPVAAQRINVEIAEKIGCAQIVFEGKFVPVVAVKIPAGLVLALEGVNGIKQIFPEHELNLYDVGDKLAWKALVKPRDTAETPKLSLEETAQIIGARRLWDMGIYGSGVSIAVVDSGVNWTHPDLLGKVVVNVSFVPGEDPMDYMGHGTHVAGIVAGTGVASGGRFRGIAPGARILNIKAFNSTGAAGMSWVLAALDYTLQVKPHIALLCWGAVPLPESHPLNLYMAEFARNGILAVAAAGNEAYYWTVGSPANSPHVISVGATTKNDKLAFYSSRGPDVYTLRTLPLIAAPGEMVTAPCSGWLLQSHPLPDTPYYASLSGTSMAAAHVAGAAALLMSVYPKNPEAVRAALMVGAEDLGCDPCAAGAGRLNVHKAYASLLRGAVSAVFHPRNITGAEAPFVACFPGDRDWFNITVIAGAPLREANLAIAGNASKIFYIQRRMLGHVRGFAFIGANITIPEKASPGKYVGVLMLREGEEVVAQLPIRIVVSRPMATILWDDIHDHVMGWQFLWRWYVTCWQRVSLAGVRILPYSLVGYELILQPRKFNAVILMDPYWAFTEHEIKTLIEYVKGGGNLIIVYGQRAALTRLDEVAEEFGIEVIKLWSMYGYPIYSNKATILLPEHPAVSMVKNLTVISGWISLKTKGAARPLLNVTDVAYYNVMRKHGYAVPCNFTVMAFYEHAPYVGRLLVIGNDYMFDDVWIGLWWDVKFPNIIINYAQTPDNPMLACNAAKWGIGDFEPPSACLLEPSVKYVRGTVTIKISAADGQSGLDRVDFYVNHIHKFTDVDAPYQLDWNTAEHPDGTYTIQAVVYDRAGNVNSTTLSLVVDNTPPHLKIASPSNYSYIRGFTAIHLSVFDANLHRLSYIVDNGSPVDITGKDTFIIDTTTLANGAHTVTIIAVDKSGNVAMEVLHLVVDNIPPHIKITAPLETYVKGAVTIKAVVEDLNLEKAELQISGETVHAWATPGMQIYSWNTFNLPDGEYVLTLIARDKAGNTDISKVKVIVDNTNPEAEIKKPSAGAFLRGVFEVVLYGYDAHIESLLLYVDDKIADAWRSSGFHSYMWDTARLVDGEHSLRLVISDMSGNRVERGFTVIVDNTPPAISIITPREGAVLTGIVPIKFNVSDNHLSRILLYIDDAVYNVTGDTSFTWNSTMLADGNHVIRIVAADESGNVQIEQIMVTTINFKIEKEEGYVSGRDTGIKIGVGVSALAGLSMGVIIICIRVFIKKKTVNTSISSSILPLTSMLLFQKAFFK